MITPDTAERTNTPANTPPKSVPKIEREEDLPFPSKQANPHSAPKSTADDKLHQTDDIEKEITRFRFTTGRVVLYVAMFAMVVMVLLDLYVSQHFGAERDMIENAFEAFKLISVTVLGYIFGSSGIGGSNSSK